MKQKESAGTPVAIKQEADPAGRGDEAYWPAAAPYSRAGSAGKDMPVKASAKDQLQPLRPNLCLGSCFVRVQGNASLQAGSPALQPGSAQPTPPGFHSGQPAFRCAKTRTPRPPIPGGDFLKVAKILPETWRTNHTRPRAKLWFANAELKPLGFRCGPAGTPRRTRASTTANPL